MKKVSIVICTYNRASILEETLPTILNQEISDDQFDIIVVDNNSNDDTEQLIGSQKQDYSNLYYIKELNQGASFARNTGYKFAKSDWIIFLDDDAKVPETFIKTAISIIDEDALDCFGGIYYPWYKYEKPKWFKDRYASTAILFDDEKVAPQHTYISAGIMTIKKSVLDDIGGFSTILGPQGKKMFYGEETHLHNKLLKNNYKVEIKPEWKMHHLVDKNKYKLKWFFRNGLAIGKQYWLIYEDNVTIKKLIKYLSRTITKVFSNTKQLLKKDYYIQNLIAENLRICTSEFGRQISGIKLLFSGERK